MYQSSQKQNNCIQFALENGFEYAQQSRLPFILKQGLICKGRAYIRDSICFGLSIVNKIYEKCRWENIDNLWNIVQIVIVDGDDEGSQISSLDLCNNINHCFQQFPQNFLKIIVLYINADFHQSIEFQELANGRQIQLICSNLIEVDQQLESINRKLNQFDNENYNLLNHLVQKHQQLIILNIELTDSICNKQIGQPIINFVRQINQQSLVCGIGFNQVSEILTLGSQQKEKNSNQESVSCIKKFVICFCSCSFCLFVIIAITYLLIFFRHPW